MALLMTIVSDSGFEHVKILVDEQENDKNVNVGIEKRERA